MKQNLMRYSDCIAKETAAMLALTLFAFVALYLSSCGAQARPIANSPCLPDDPQAREWVNRVLTIPVFEEQRQSVGLTGVAPEDVELLSDGPMCETLKDKYVDPDKKLRYVVIYKAGDRVLVALPIQDDPEKNGGWVVAAADMLMVYNMSLNKLEDFKE